MCRNLYTETWTQGTLWWTFLLDSVLVKRELVTLDSRALWLRRCEARVVTVGVSRTFSTTSAAVTLLQSVLVGVLGDFHFQALRICTQEKKLLHSYYVYEVTVQPAGGTCRPHPNAGPRASVAAVVQRAVASIHFLLPRVWRAIPR